MTQATETIAEKIAAGSSVIPLPSIGSWSASAHRFDDIQLGAIRAAELAGRPLLVRGEPGLGKSQIARAIAATQQWHLVTTVVNARTEIEDLLYSVDHVSRLSAANRAQQVEDIEDYIRKGPIWRALSLTEYSDNDRPGDRADKGWYKPTEGCVLLIDEIDKAQSDVPNALLEVLNAGKFDVPLLDKVIGASNPNIFIVVSANDDRSLPAAFLRRCATLHLTLGSNPVDDLVSTAKAHMQVDLLGPVTEEICRQTAQQLVEYRRDLSTHEYKPGTSEYLDLLRAIGRSMQRDDSLTEEQISILIADMSKYLIKKLHYPDAKQ